MRLLALDQASHCTGFAYFDGDNLIECGTFNTIHTDLGKRLVEYRKKLQELLNNYDIEKVAFEDIQLQTSAANNVATFKILAEIFGITQELLAELKIPYEIVSSNTWKSKLNIKGKRREEQKKNALIYVQENFNTNPKQDAADAVCIGAFILLPKKAGFNWD